MKEIYQMLAIMIVFILSMCAIGECIYMFLYTRMMTYLGRTAILMAIMVVCVVVFRLIYLELFI